MYHPYNDHDYFSTSTPQRLQEETSFAKSVPVTTENDTIGNVEDENILQPQGNYNNSNKSFSL